MATGSRNTYENYPFDVAPPPYTPPNSETFSHATHYKYKDSVICSTCGQLHEHNGTHLYDYHQAVDEELMCHICLQPLVNPIDTKCGHTYCSRCLKNYLKLQKQCPVDRQPLTVSDCQKSSLLVRRLLDKLLVVCPNVDYCEEVLPRSELDSHLAHRCRGAITRCIKASLGCTFQGPRSALQSHLWECHYRDQTAGDRIETVATSIDLRSEDSLRSTLIKRSNTDLGELDLDLQISQNNEYRKNPVLHGEVSTIEIQRDVPELGISIVGGCDTPLACVVIQEVFTEGCVAKDGRLQPGDQILEVNGEDLTQSTHYQARQALGHYFPVCRVTVYREKAEEDRPIEKEEILKIVLTKTKGRQLGIKLVGKRQAPGVFILNVLPNSVASLDGRLRADDHVLQINNMDVMYSTQEYAAQIIQSSQNRVQFVISRKTRPQTPDIIRSTSDAITNLNLDSSGENAWSACRRCQELTLSITKEPSESLGISIAGGMGSPRGDIPVYVTNINPGGCLGQSGQIQNVTPSLHLLQKGDLILYINNISLLNLPHPEAVSQIRVNAGAKVVTLKIIEAPETSNSDGNFVPSWLYWHNLPKFCQTVKTVTLLRSPYGSLGFSVVGGSDCMQGNLPIYIKSVVLETPAFKDGRLRCGDIILSVNPVSLENVTHAKAVEVLKNATGAVTLTVVSWPGTIV